MQNYHQCVEMMQSNRQVEVSAMPATNKYQINPMLLSHLAQRSVKLSHIKTAQHRQDDANGWAFIKNTSIHLNQQVE